MDHVIYSLNIHVTKVMQSYWLFLMLYDTRSFPGLQYHTSVVLCIRSNGNVFSLLALSVCSAASGQFPHMMATFTLGSYTCTHLHSNANRNSLFVKAALRFCRQHNDSLVFMDVKPVLFLPYSLAVVVTFIPLCNKIIRDVAHFYKVTVEGCFFVVVIFISRFCDYILSQDLYLPHIYIVIWKQHTYKNVKLFKYYR